MSDQLKELLRGLADDSPTIDTSPAAIGTVWSRARRSRRRDLVATVSVGLVVLLIGGLVIGLLGPGLRSTPPTTPPYGDGKLAIPNEIWAPSPWTPGTADAGPIGPLALIATAPRHTSWWHTDQLALFGVSARTGEYRFLDLPRLAPNTDAEPVLSPDGRYLAYFITGHPSGSYVQSQVTGIAIYDTESGASTFHAVPTVHGLNDEALAWNGESTRAVAVFGQYSRRPGTSYEKPPLVANALTGKAARLPLATVDVLDGGTAGPVPGGVGVMLSDDPGFAVIHVVSGQTVRIAFGRQGQKSHVRPQGPPLIKFSAGLGAFAGSPDVGGIGPALYVGHLPCDCILTGPPVWRVDTGQPFVIAVDGWARRHRLLVQQWPDGGPRPNGTPQIYSVGLQGGEPRMAIRLHPSSPYWLQPTFASDLLSHAFVAGRGPASPTDPRLVPGIIVGILVGLGLIWYVVAAFRRLGRVPPPIDSSSGSST